jgi:hypothetical protein
MPLYLLDLMNRLSNKDRHQRLSVITWGLGQVQAKVVLKGSGRIETREISGQDPTHRGFKNNASIPVPDGVVYVKLRGTPVILVRIGGEWNNFKIPDAFWGCSAGSGRKPFPARALLLQGFLTFSPRTP